MAPIIDISHTENSKGELRTHARTAAPNLDSTRATDTPTATKPKTPRQRQQHTKSRRGCLTCKARKIKCGEEFPTCARCRFRGTTCRYPADVMANATTAASSTRDIFVPFVPAVAKQQSVPPSPSGSPVFTIQEMRFFHHFLTSMRHPLPLGNHSVWVEQIPQISHVYPFLLHAILALGASEMDHAGLPASVHYDVLKHRGRAISGLNEALDDPKAWAVYGHSDAVLAACYALIYQSCRIPDGMQDFQVLVRGCSLVTDKIRQLKLRTILNVSPDWPRQRLESGVYHIQANIPEGHMALISRGLQSLQHLDAVADLSGAQQFWKALVVTLDQFHSSPSQGYTFSILSWSGWYNLATGLLDALRKEDNWTAIVLVAAYLANMMLLKVLIPLEIWPEDGDRLPTRTLRQMTQWVDTIYEHMDESRRQHLAWIKQVVREVPELPLSQRHSFYDTRDANLPSSHSSILQNLATRAHMFLGDILMLGSDATAWFEEFVSSKHHQQLHPPTQTQARTDEKDASLPRAGPRLATTMSPSTSFSADQLSLPFASRSDVDLSASTTDNIYRHDVYYEAP